MSEQGRCLRGLSWALPVCLVFWLLLGLALASASKLGWEYGMNRTLGLEVMYEVNQTCDGCLDAVGLVRFSNSKCVAHYDNYCSQGSYKWSISPDDPRNYVITIGAYSRLNREEMAYLFYHELAHVYQGSDEENANNWAWEQIYRFF